MRDTDVSSALVQNQRGLARKLLGALHKSARVLCDLIRRAGHAPNPPSDLFRQKPIVSDLHPGVAWRFGVFFLSFFSWHSCAFRPALSETRTEGGYRTCSIARSTSDDYRDMYDYPAEGTPQFWGLRVARLRRPTPCRQSSTTTARSGGADRAPSKDSRRVQSTRRLNSAGAASFARRTSLLQEVV